MKVLELMTSYVPNFKVLGLKIEEIIENVEEFNNYNFNSLDIFKNDNLDLTNYLFNQIIGRAIMRNLNVNVPFHDVKPDPFVYLIAKIIFQLSEKLNDNLIFLKALEKITPFEKTQTIERNSSNKNYSMPINNTEGHVKNMTKYGTTDILTDINFNYSTSYKEALEIKNNIIESIISNCFYSDLADGYFF